jgi:hypothetical protein
MFASLGEAPGDNSWDGNLEFLLMYWDFQWNHVRNESQLKLKLEIPMTYFCAGIGRKM